VPEDHEQLGAIVENSGRLLPEKNAVGLDPNNAAGVSSALFGAGVTDEQIRRLLQGPALAPAHVWPRAQAQRGHAHACRPGADGWVRRQCQGRGRGNGGKMITKQVSGRAKIDPLIALLQAVILMSWNPEGAHEPRRFSSQIPIMVV
jgi:hypothetical protein